MDKKDIKDLTIEELRKELSRIAVPSYRAVQIFHWIYRRGVEDFRDMDNIPDSLKCKLEQFYYIGNVKLREHLKSVDGTEKFLFELSDGSFIESVLIYSQKRKTLCLSTQVGCKYGCCFCASGARGFVRNLTPSEILSQILFLRHTSGHQITNFVFMGMGEPLDNYDNLLTSIMIMNSKDALGIGARRITVSTCGIIPAIEKFSGLPIQINLSISLHAASNKLRDGLAPVNKRYPLEKLISACRGFIEKSGRRITLEYVLIKGKNDALQDASGLASIAKILKAKVNLIPYSRIPDRNFESPSKKEIETFRKALIKHRINVTVRESKGKDIEAACGQLALRRTNIIDESKRV